jgi:hypothetical protein
MRSGRATVGEPARKRDPEKTRAQKKKSDWLVNADLKLIGDPTRIEEPSEATLRSLLIGPSDRRCNLVRAEATGLIASSVGPRFNAYMPALTRKRVNDRPETWHIHYAGVRVGVTVEHSGAPPSSDQSEKCRQRSIAAR